uniref:Uncharacterized protein n=1 Tax=Peronospora matthiolae TaxID=2874970 RepID=A0AAV1TCK6_9STRA
MPTLESKTSLRDLRSDKIKQICVLVTEDIALIAIWLAQVFTENERVLSSYQVDESVLDEKTRIEAVHVSSVGVFEDKSLYQDLVESGRFLNPCHAELPTRTKALGMESI